MSEISMLKPGWDEVSKIGDYVRAQRGNESAVFHLHREAKEVRAYFCIWVGDFADCPACNGKARLSLNGDSTQ